MAEHSGGTRGNGGVHAAPAVAAAVAAPGAEADRMVSVSFTLLPKHVAFLTAKAQRHGLTVSALLRVMLNRWMR